ncbi:TPA: hypothetical protein P7C74_004822 [Escherichia coli]|nr:hypothetical protein [Escherichia coli]
MSDKVCSDIGIFNGSFVDHSWICLLDRASGYVDKSFQKDSAHNRFMKGLQGVPAHCNYRYIALLRRFAGFAGFAGFARSPVCGEHCFFDCYTGAEI